MIKQALAALLVVSAQSWTLPARAFSEDYALAIKWVTDNPTPAQKVVATSVRDGVSSFESLVRFEIIRTPYDCPPEFRVNCMQAILHVANDSPELTEPPEEWGEWTELPTAADFAPIAEAWAREALETGFNLLANEEVRPALFMRWRDDE